MLNGYNLSAEALAQPIVNITTNLPGADSDYYNWELTGTRRETTFWSLQASFAYTWSKETALSAGAGYTPNSFINTDNERLNSTTWQAKLLGTVKLKWDFRVTPTIRHQAGNSVRADLHPDLQLGQRHGSGRADRRGAGCERQRVRHSDGEGVPIRPGRGSRGSSTSTTSSTPTRSRSSPRPPARRGCGRSRSRRRGLRGSASSSSGETADGDHRWRRRRR